ncbi:MAG TPA: PRC-barrel domain-containing protein [Acidimicrobiia bacterium]|jgi:hypothetical protein
MTDIWSYEEDLVDVVQSISGFDVEARDGRIGTIDDATLDVGSSYIVVDTGPWIFGKKVLLPAGLIEAIDLDEEIVYVDRTKEEIKKAPELPEGSFRDDAYRVDIATYYASGPLTF